MEELLEMYRNFKDNGIIDASTYNFENINLVMDGNAINLYDVSGTMPCGRYKIPPNESYFIEFLNKMNEKIGELIDANQFICGKCGGTFELPETKRDRHGNLICEKCASGGDIRKEDKAKVEKSQPKESEIPSTVKAQPNKELSVQDAIELLNKSGYVVKKLVKSYKVVYMDASGETGVTKTFFRDKDDFVRQNPDKQFVTFVKELNKADEEGL